MTTSDTSYRTILLTQNQVAIVDDADYESISKSTWCAHWVPSSNCFRAMRRIGGRPNSYVVYMHREIMGLEKGDPRMVDHINGNGLDNRRSNLRFADKAKNAWNSRLNKNNKSGCAGVSWDKKTGKWYAKIVANRKFYFLGYHDKLSDAVAARLSASRKLYGEFARFK